MKKIYKKLCAVAFALMGATSLSAQTDVTSTYLTNAGFDDESGWVTSNVKEKTISTVPNWVGASTGTDWFYGGAIDYSKSFTVNSVKPATNPDGATEGGALGLSAGWGCTVKYTQAVTLPAGVYTLTYKAYNANTAATQANNYIGFTCSAGNYYGTISNFTANTWVEESINFVLTSETSGNISVGMGAISGGSGANAKLFVDGVTLSYTNFSDVTAGNPIDLTSMGSGSWTGQTGSVSAGGVSSVSEAYTWGSPRPTGTNLSKAITGLPVGKYNIEVYCASSTTSNRDNTSYPVTDGDEQYITLTANSESVNIPSYNRTDISGDLPYYTFNEMVIQDGNLNLAMNVNVQAPNWLLVKVKSITFLGPDKTLSEEAFNTKMTSLKALDSSKPMPASISTELTSLISEYGEIDPVNLTQSQLDVVNVRMDYVINNYDAGVAAYVKLQEYIDMTEVFTDVTTYQTKLDNGEYSTDDVEPVRRELNVVRYNAASDVFTNKVEVTGWTGDLANGVRSDQHWSGNTVSYYDANSWTNSYVGLTHTLSTTITLPEGSYVLKAAGRSSSDATLTLDIKNGDTSLGSVEYTGKGDTGYGIDTSGAANFADEGTYANGDAGRGWEWEFAKFELDAETTVTLFVEVDYNSIQNRFGSFSDITLWMDDDTYLSVNGGAIDEPLAQAKALNTAPMGENEMNALAAAIALGEAEITTADQLNEALAALETAIANANTWRTAYNEAKAPLITEMELFESDYNDNSVEWSNKCAKGQLYTTTWQAYITAIQEAAVAKDVVTDGYDFATHTTALANARTAVDASIAVYANLKAEIGYANNYDLVVSSNQSDYTATINAAQAVWDGGTKEDPSAEILAMQNFKVLDYNYVTETYEGVATLGDWGGNSESTNKGEHWDGTAESSYYDYSRWSGDAGNFEVTQEYNLPAGTYVLMAAGRCANVDGTDAYIKVKEEKVYFDKKGGSGFGISTDGKASFNPTETYANTTGRGWEYRFIEFTLNSEETVTIGLGYTVADSHNPLSWAGVCAPQLRAKKLTMTDKADIENETKEGYMVSYDREFTAEKWTTVIVPFDYELPDGVTAEELDFIAFNGPDNNWISFKEVTELKANTPYILKNTSATPQLFADLGIKTVYSTASTNSVVVEGATMKGTYTSISAKDLVAQEGGNKDIIFINQNGEGRYIDNAEPAAITFPAGRAYIVVDGSTFDIANNVAPRFTIFHGDDDITSIEETLNQKNEEEVIYDLAGRRIVKPTKAGIYIVNGKKMVIK